MAQKNKYQLNKKTIDKWVNLIQDNFNDLMENEAANLGEDYPKKDLETIEARIEKKMFNELGIIFEQFPEINDDPDFEGEGPEPPGEGMGLQPGEPEYDESVTTYGKRLEYTDDPQWQRQMKYRR